MPAYKILSKQKIAPDIFQLEVSAPLVAAKFQAGQFIVLRPLPDSERVPLTIMNADRKAGSITLIVKAIGLSTKQLCEMNAGDEISDLLGPLGRPSEIGKYGTVVVVGGGVGTAVAFAVAEALKNAGNHIIALSGARNKDFVILEEDFRSIADQVIITTDDGSYGKKGFITHELEALYAQGIQIDRVISAGPLPMMKLVSDITQKYNTPTVVSLNPIMVDGIGMCGGCRAVVGGKIVFVCVDGPEFDAHQVDFDSLIRRNTAYRAIEQQKEHDCKLDEQLAGDVKGG
ncbi:MAG: sulfide/dihydroorotate dehydrogenase-like FAD/NAD-binding protein [Pelolinea sp.]|nr:sulfide/dihydroorotate dehydrogenase-like FAD/NAD-binding protein [Pelolinea sp.]